ncbi:MAG: hypothetical protein J6T10_16560 [Methanobrevibacter sp.]|nr:hypothetical protein [Methanobrevibacter sp.]
MLKPIVKTFLRNYIALNGLSMSEIDHVYITCYKYYTEFEFCTTNKDIFNIDINSLLFDTDLFDKDHAYGLEELGII